MNTNMNENQPIACEGTAIPASDRDQHLATVTQIFQAVQEVRELSNGYAFKLPNEPGMFMMLANFVENERLCCPFYGFGLELEPGGGPVWLRLTGGEGVKQFIETIFSDVPGAIDKQLIRFEPDDNLNEAISQAAPIAADLIEKAIPLQQGNQ